jgi:hypothetical protein
VQLLRSWQRLDRIWPALEIAIHGPHHTPTLQLSQSRFRLGTSLVTNGRIHSFGHLITVGIHQTNRQWALGRQHTTDLSIFLGVMQRSMPSRSCSNGHKSKGTSVRNPTHNDNNLDLITTIIAILSHRSQRRHCPTTLSNHCNFGAKFDRHGNPSRRS